MSGPRSAAGTKPICDSPMLSFERKGEAKKTRSQKWRLLPALSHILSRLGKGNSDCCPYSQEGGGAQTQKGQGKGMRGMEP